MLDPPAGAALGRNGGRGVLGVRPEHFTLVGSAEGGLAATIKLVEPLGSDTLVHFDVGGTSAIARVEPDLRPRVGDVIGLRVVPGKAHAFDAEDGRVLS